METGPRKSPQEKFSGKVVGPNFSFISQVLEQGDVLVGVVLWNPVRTGGHFSGCGFVESCALAALHSSVSMLPL